MVSFTLRAIHSGGAVLHGMDIGDLHATAFQGQMRLFAASRVDGGLTVFSLGEGLQATLSGDVAASPSSGTYGVGDIEIVDIGGTSLLAAAGRYDDAFAFRVLTQSGGFGNLVSVSPIPQSTAALSEIEFLAFGSTTYMIAGRDSAAGLTVFAITPGYGLSFVGGMADNASVTLANVSDLVTFNTGSTHLVFAASSFEHCVTSFSMAPDGQLSVVDTIDGMKGYGIYQATELAVVTADDSDFLIVGASGSGNLTVFAIGAGGNLTMTDMVWDTLDTRFRKVTALESFDYNGRAFVVAGGTDGGMTLFELGPNGKLYFIINVLDTQATTLNAVSAIEVAVVGGEVQVFVASSLEPGITQFTLDMGAIGNVVSPSGPSNGAVGSPGDDFLSGDDGWNVLRGMNGNDRIVDGGGMDEVYGGAGADTFVFVQDGMYDRVMDYQAGVDRIDLSDFDRVYSIAALDIDSTVYGARITIGSEAILLISADGQPLMPSDFTQASFIF